MRRNRIRQAAAVEGLTVRPERPSDAAAIGSVVAAAFGSPAEAALVEAIRASDGYIAELSLVAELDEAVVGHVMISYVGLRTEDGIRQVPSLSPLAAAFDDVAHD